MEVIKTDIEGVVIIEPRIFKDARGYFFESFSKREFDEKVRPVDFVQDNESCSTKGVMRARPAFPASALHAVQAGALCQGCRARRGRGHPQGLADIRQVCGRRADRGQSPPVLRAQRVCPRIRRAVGHRCLPLRPTAASPFRTTRSA